jgi:hypothetical protein
MKTFTELIDDAFNNEELLGRTDKLKEGSNVICCKQYKEKTFTFTNLRTFIKYQKNKEYWFNVGESHRIERINNFVIYISYAQKAQEAFSLIGVYMDYKNFFDYFMLESEWHALQRDKKIDTILE